jgi:GrpB-like predicted nucleotidyltransferase (UPF0157 family)
VAEPRNESRWEVVSYDPGWPAAFAAVTEALMDALPPRSYFDHIGSTAVPGMVAKPKIDIDLVVPALETTGEAIERLAVHGYVHDGDRGVPGREAFFEPPSEIQHRLYVVVENSEAHRRHTVLRDFLRRQPDAVREYSEVKLRFARSYPTDPAAYAARKASLLQRLSDQARRDRSQSAG